MQGTAAHPVTTLENEVHRLRAIIDAQNAALNHWRRISDASDGEIARLQRELAEVRADLATVREFAEELEDEGRL